MVLLGLGGFLSAAPAVEFPPLSLPLPNDMGLLPQAIQTEIRNAFLRVGFESSSTNHPARFVAQGQFVVEKEKLILQLTFIDKIYQSVVASESVTIHQGLMALDPLKTTMRAMASQAMLYWNKIKDKPLPVPVIIDPLEFTSSDEGTTVYWQGHVSIGTITHGAVTAPYYPFPSTALLTLTLEKPGYRTKIVTLGLKAGKTSYSLPKLAKLRIDEWHPFVETGKLLGLGLEYRHYFLPDWAFWGAEVYPFLQWRPDVKTSQAVLHSEFGGTAGTWLYFPASSWFRFGLQSTFDLSLTYTVSSPRASWYLDGLFSPIVGVLEWNFWGFTIENRIQVPYSLGFPTGVLGARWLLIDGQIPSISIGTVLRW